MGKVRISVKSACSDIRAGMDDSALMDKYKLSPRGLDSLFKKLVAGGFVDTDELERRVQALDGTVTLDRDALLKDLPPREPIVQPAPVKKAKALVNPYEAIKLIKAGWSDLALMEEYHLTATGLKSLFTKLVAAGYVQQELLDKRVGSFEDTVDLLTVIEELRVGAPGEPAGKASAEARQKEAAARAALHRRMDPIAALLSPSPPAEDEDDASDVAQSDAPTSHAPAWYDRPAILLFLIVFVFPVGLYGLLHSSRTSKTTKIVVTCAVLGGVVVGLLFFVGPSFGAKALVDGMNREYGQYCHFQLSGWFTKTLRVSWTSRAQEHRARTIGSRILGSRIMLKAAGVTYLEIPNKAGTYDRIDLATGARTRTKEPAVFRSP